jgi:hypothetical protein
MFWIDNRNEIQHDQLELFRRGLTAAARPNCCDDPDIAARGFTEDQHNWMVPYPRAFVIPFDGTGQRSDAEANRMVQWLLDNGIQVEFLKQSYNWKAGRTTFPKNSYVVWLDQPLRGLALTTLDEGQDISDRISQLYAPPGAWSHGQLWGADVVEIPAGSSSFNPTTQPLTEPHALLGGVGGFKGKPTWYSLTLRGVSEVRAVLDLLRSGIDAEVAESSLGTTPAGSLIFPADTATAAALSAAGQAAGVVFVPHQGAKPPTTQVDESPRIAVLVNSAAPAMSDTMWSLQQIFGSDAAFVSTVTGTNSLQNAVTDPLLDYDIIYNAGQNYPSAANATAQARLQAFFARGGGYIGTSQSGNNFAFLSGAGLVTSPLTQASDSAGGGIARWDNVGLNAPLTSGYTAQDFLYLPSNVTYFSATPAGSVVDGRYLPDTTSMFVAGLWLDRDPAAAGAPMVLHGDTTVGSRYAALATNPFSRGDAEREWLWVGQAALWSNLTDEV